MRNTIKKHYGIKFLPILSIIFITVFFFTGDKFPQKAQVPDERIILSGDIQEYVNSSIRASYGPREIPVRAERTLVTESHQKKSIRVKFKDHLQMNQENGTMTNLCIEGWEAEAEALKINLGTWSDFIAPDSRQFFEMWKTAENKLNKQLPNFFSLFTYDIPEGADAGEMIDFFNRLECVERAYPIPIFALPGGNSENGTNSMNQPIHYPWLNSRDAANPYNVNARKVWEEKGITGRHVNIGILAWGPPPTAQSNDYPLVDYFGPNPSFFGGGFDAKNFSIAGAKNNESEEFYTGISYNSRFSALSILKPNCIPIGFEDYNCADVAQGLAYAAQGMPRNAGSIIISPWVFKSIGPNIEMPISADQDSFNMIQFLSANGFICVLAAGNSNTNLSTLGNEYRIQIINANAFTVSGGSNANTFGNHFDPLKSYVATYPDTTDPGQFENSAVSAVVLGSSAALIQSFRQNLFVSEFGEPTNVALPFEYLRQYPGILYNPLEVITNHQQNFSRNRPVIRIQTNLPKAEPMRVTGNSTIDLGNTNKSIPITGELNLFNDGERPLNLSNARIVPVNVPEDHTSCTGIGTNIYSWVETPPTTIRSGERAKLKFQLCTNTVGQFEADIRINTNVPDFPQIKIPFKATVLGEASSRMVVTNIDGLRVESENTIDFGINQPQAYPNKRFTIKNVGERPLIGRIQSSPAEGFIYEFDTPQKNSFTVPPGEVINLIIRYRNNNIGTHNHQFVLDTNEAGDRLFRLNLLSKTIEQNDDIKILGFPNIALGSGTHAIDLGAYPSDEVEQAWVYKSLQLVNDGVEATRLLYQFRGVEDQANGVQTLTVDPFPTDAFNEPVEPGRRIPLVVRRSMQGSGVGKFMSTAVFSRQHQPGSEHRGPIIVNFRTMAYKNGPNGIRLYLSPPGNSNNLNSVNAETLIPIGSKQFVSTTRGTSVTQTYILRNTSSRRITIQHYESTDPHIAVNARSTSIAPGGEMRLDVTLLAFEEGNFKSSIWFQTDDETTASSDPFFVFDLEGAVLPGTGGCVSELNPNSQSFQLSGGQGTINVTAPSNCNWNATSSVPWVSIVNGASGMGSRTVSYIVSESTSGTRTGEIYIGGETFTVNQSGNSQNDGIYLRQNGSRIENFGQFNFFTRYPNLSGSFQFELVNDTDQRIKVNQVEISGGGFFGGGYPGIVEPHSVYNFAVDVPPVVESRLFEGYFAGSYDPNSDDGQFEAIPFYQKLTRGPVSIFPISDLPIRMLDAEGGVVPYGRLNTDYGNEPIDGVFDLGSSVNGVAKRDIRIFNDSAQPIKLYDLWRESGSSDLLEVIGDDVIIEPSSWATIRVQVRRAEIGTWTTYVKGTYSSLDDNLETANGFWIPLKYTIEPAPLAIVTQPFTGYLAKRVVPGQQCSGDHRWGRVEVGQFVRKTYRITNNGQTNLEITDLPKVTATTANPWSINIPANFRTVIPPGEYTEFNLRFQHNQVVSRYEMAVQFGTNDFAGLFKFCTEIQVVPRGQLSSRMIVKQGADEIYNSGVFDSTQPTGFTVENPSSDAINLSNLTIPAGYTLTTPLPSNLPPGGVGQFAMVKTDPGAPTGESARIAFETDIEDIGVFEFTDNSRPFALDDTEATNPGTPVTINVTQNDYDNDGDDVRLITQPITVPPQNGIAVRQSDSGITYTPNTGFIGTDTFQYEIGDGHGRRSRAVVTINVGQNRPPIAVDDAVATAPITSVLIKVTANDADPDGNGVSLISNPIVVAASNGQAVKYSDSEITYTPNQGFLGTDSFQYEIGDGRGGRSRAWVRITVSDNNTPPTANNDSASTDINTPISINVTQNDTDLDGDLVRLINNPIVVSPARGTAVKISQNSISYTPAPGITGADTFQYEIGDGRGRRARAWVTVTITANNGSPIAVNDSAATETNVSVSINVTANDTDPDGDQLSLIGQPIIIAPAHGTAIKTSQNTILYTPSNGFAGTDSFQYEIGDGRGRRARGMVFVTVTSGNQSPVAVNDAALSTNGSSISIAVTSNDYDPDPLDTVGLITNPIITLPSHGTAVRTSSTVITYTPGAGFVGTDSFQYEIGDGRGRRARAWVSVTVTNDNTPPTAVDDQAVTGISDLIMINVTENDSDQDGDSVSLISLPIIVQPTHGTVVRISSTTFSYAPTPGFSGTDSFQYEIGDGRGRRARAWVNIIVTDENYPPVAVNDAFTMSRNSSISLNVTSNDYDPNGDPILLISQPVVVTPQNGTAVRMSDSTIVYTPTAGFSGTDTFQYEMGDGRGRRARGLVTVTVN